MTTLTGAEQQADGDACVRGGIVGGVTPCPAIKHIGPGPSDKGIVPITTDKGIVPISAEKHIRARSAGQTVIPGLAIEGHANGGVGRVQSVVELGS